MHTDALQEWGATALEQTALLSAGMPRFNRYSRRTPNAEKPTGVASGVDVTANFKTAKE